MNRAHKELLRKNFENAVNGYVAAFLELFEISEAYSWWVCDRIGMDLFCFNDLESISLDDMIYCVEHDIKHEEFWEYTEYNVKCIEYNLPTMNLESWHHGAQRHSFEKLDAAKKALDEAIENEKNKF